MATPDIISHAARLNYGPIADTKVAPTIEAPLVDGLTISRVLQVRAGNNNTGNILIRSKALPTAFTMGPGEVIEVDTMYDPSTILVSGSISGLSVSYMTKYVYGE